MKHYQVIKLQDDLYNRKIKQNILLENKNLCSIAWGAGVSLEGNGLLRQCLRRAFLWSCV